MSSKPGIAALSALMLLTACAKEEMVHGLTEAFLSDMNALHASLMQMYEMMPKFADFDVAVSVDFFADQT